MTKDLSDRFLVRARLMPEPCVWFWEIVDRVHQEVAESSWTEAWAGYRSRQEALQAGLARLDDLGRGPRGAIAPSRAAESRAPASAGSGSTPALASRHLLIVPRPRVELYASLKRSFADHENVQVVLDRRLSERRASPAGRTPDRRVTDRRMRRDKDAEVQAGRVASVRVAVPAPSRSREVATA
jgi:hypothetical protein